MTAREPSWSIPAHPPALCDGDIHVWRTALDRPASIVGPLRQSLSSDEQARADRFHFERDRRRYIVGRGALRSILSGYLNADPHRLQFRYGHNGKPALISNALQFNVAHSRGLALVAVTPQQEVGVDVEYMRPVLDADQLAERFFSARESAALRSLPAHERHAAFFTCWTRKEAYIKAIGEGLSQPLDQFDVSLAPGEPPHFLSIRGDRAEAQHWSLFSLAPDENYAAAIAVRECGWQVSCWTWEMSHAN